MEKLVGHGVAIWKKNMYFLRAHTVSTTLGFTGTCLGPLIVLLASTTTTSTEKDLIKIIPYMSLIGSFFLFYMVMQIAVIDKSSRAFLALRRLGVYESSYWVANFLSWAPLCLLSSILGTIAWKLLIPQDWNCIHGISWPVLFLVLLSQNFSIAAVGQMWSGIIGDEARSAMVFILYLIFSVGFFFTSFVLYDAGKPGWYLSNGFHKLTLRALYALIVPVQAFGKIWTDLFLVTFPSAFNGNQTLPFDFSHISKSVYEGVDVKALYTVDFQDPSQVYPSIIGDMLFAFVFMFVYLFASWVFNYAVPYDGFSLPPNFFLKFNFLGKLSSMQGILSTNESIAKSDRVVKLVDVSKTHFGGIKANREINQVMEPGNVYGVLGQNGAGKSTLISLLTGWSEPTKGKVTIWGYDVADEEQVVQVRHVVGYCPQYEIVFPNMTAMQHVSVYTTLKGVDVKPYGGLRPYAIHLLEKVGLEDVIDQNVDTYSGGMQRRMSFILGTIGDVKVLLLDEPCTGLDPVSRAMVWKEIEHLKKDRVIVLTTHDMEEAEYLSDSIMMLADGILIAEGSPLAIKSACGNNLNLHLTRKKDSPIQTSLTAIRLWTQASIPGSTAVIDMDEETETLQIPRNQLKLLADFTTMIEKESILNWSLKNITMEEAFLTIINLDEDEFKAKKDDPPVVYEAVPLIPFAEFLESADIAESVLTDSEKDVIPDAALFTVEFEHGIMQQLRSQRYKVFHLAVGNWPSFAMIVVAYLWIIILTQAIGKSLGLDSQGIIRFGLILSTPFFAELIIVNRNSKMLELELTHGLNQAMFWPALYWATFATSSIFSIFALYPFAIIRGQKEKVGTGLLNGPYILSLFVLCVFIGHASGSCAVFFGCVFRSKLALIFIWSILCISILVNFDNDWMSLFPFVAMYNFLKVNDQPALLSNAYWHLVKGFFGGLGLAIFGIGFDFVLNNKPKPRARTPKKVSQAGNNDAVVKMERIDAGVEKANEEIAELFRNNTVVPNEHLRIAKVCKNYGSHIAVNELSMRLFRDETFVILGENGSGKSTTFGMIQGTIKPTSGSISVNSKIAICKQHDMLWDNMSVNHHMRYFSMLNGVPEDDLKQWFEKIKAFGLITDSMMHQYPSDLSGGMRRRLSVALSMIGDADVLLLDEPSTGLDPKNRNQLWDSIFNIRKQKGKSIILSTHSMQEADALSDRIGVMKDGRLIALGTKNDLNIRYGNMMKFNVVLIIKDGQPIEEGISKFLDLVKSDLSSGLTVSKMMKCPRNHGSEMHVYISFEIVKSNPMVLEIFKNVNGFCVSNEMKEWGLNESTSEDIFFNVLHRK